MGKERILVVDDDKFIRSLLKDYLQTLGYAVLTAEDGEEALNMFSPGKFDCIISDLVMPNLDGYDLLQRVKLLDKDALFIMITGSPDMHGAIHATEAGAFDVITKPFRTDHIRRSVERALIEKAQHQT